MFILEHIQRLQTNVLNYTGTWELCDFDTNRMIYVVSNTTKRYSVFNLHYF